MESDKKCRNNEICPFHPIEISEDREVVDTDNKEHKWKQDPAGYFLVKIDHKTEMIHCGFVDAKNHKMLTEFKGKDVEKMIKEIAERKICNLNNMGYIASELERAKFCLETNKEYVQR